MVAPCRGGARLVALPTAERSRNAPPNQPGWQAVPQVESNVVAASNDNAGGLRHSSWLLVRTRLARPLCAAPKAASRAQRRVVPTPQRATCKHQRQSCIGGKPWIWCGMKGGGSWLLGRLASDVGAGRYARGREQRQGRTSQTPQGGAECVPSPRLGEGATAAPCHCAITPMTLYHPHETLSPQ